MVADDNHTAATAAEFIDPFRNLHEITPFSEAERAMIRVVNQKIAARPSLRSMVDYLFERTQPLIPCDRIGLAFVDERGERVTSYYNRASYSPLFIDADYAEALHQTSLEQVLRTGRPRIINDLRAYLEEHPQSRSTRRLVREGVRSNLACPLSVEGRVVGFIFRSSRQPRAFTFHHVELQLTLGERLSQAVEKAWRIEQLEEANRAYTSLLGFVSHELKSPVASILTDAQLLVEGYLGALDEAQTAKLEGIVRKGKYLISLVNEYLDLARIEGGELRLDPQARVDVLRDVVGEAVALVEPQIEARGMRLVQDLPTQAPPEICGDATLLRIVAVNLLDNAVKYGAEGGEIRLRVALTRPPGLGPGSLRVTVRNQGMGFGADQRDKLFRRFSRLDDAAHKSIRGTGVGLYNAWRIIQLHKGRITAESRQGEWAEFSFEIPATAACGAAESGERGSAL